MLSALALCQYCFDRCIMLDGCIACVGSEKILHGHMAPSFFMNWTLHFYYRKWCMRFLINRWSDVIVQNGFVTYIYHHLFLNCLQCIGEKVYSPELPSIQILFSFF